MQAVADNVIIREVDPQKTTQGGIVIPDTVFREQIIGEVISAGPGPRRNGGEMQCKPGDRIIARKTVFFPFTNPDDHEKYMSVPEQDVICILGNSDYLKDLKDAGIGMHVKPKK